MTGYRRHSDRQRRTEPKLVKFLLKKLNSVGKIKDGDGSVFMPMNDEGMSEGYVFLSSTQPQSL